MARGRHLGRSLMPPCTQFQMPTAPKVPNALRSNGLRRAAFLNPPVLTNRHRLFWARWAGWAPWDLGGCRRPDQAIRGPAEGWFAKTKDNHVYGVDIVARVATSGSTPSINEQTSDVGCASKQGARR